MNLLVIGGTGRTGARVAAAALEAGHRVVAMGRSASSATVPTGVTPFPGDAADPSAVAAAVAGVEAVVIALSIPRAGPSPFAAVTGRPDLHSANARAVIEAMTQAGVSRLVKVSAQGVGPSAARAGWGFRALIAASNLGPAFADHAVADARIAASALDWTIVHPPILSDDPEGSPLVAGEHESTGTFTRVARADLARWIVAALGDPTWRQRRVTITPK